MISEERYKRVEKLIINYLDHKPAENLTETIEILMDAQQLEKDIFESIKKGNFEMAYQPKFELNGKEKTTKSAEALFRVKEEYPVNPEVVFVLLKKFKHEKEVLLDYQLPVICKDLAKFKDSFGDDYKVSINIASELLNDEFYNKLKSELDKNHLSFKNIEIEILESENFENMKKIPMINKLKSEGVLFAIDDFGSRNADKFALSSMQFDVVKIDKSILETARNNDDYSTIQKMVDFAKKKNPNVRVVVEGIDSDKDIENLKKIGGIIYQGWKFSKAISSDKLIEKFGATQMGE